VVQVGVRVDDRRDRPVAAVAAVQSDRRGGDLRRDQRIDDDDPVVAFDQRHVGHVKPADLVNAVRHLIQAVLGGELGLPPQARVNRVRARPGQLPPRLHLPDHAAIRSFDDHRVQRADEPTVSVGEVSAVTEIGAGQFGVLCRSRH
jgi:hypothetical protein